MNWRQYEKMVKDYKTLKKSNPDMVKKLCKLINDHTKEYMTRYMFEDKFQTFSLPKLVIDIAQAFIEKDKEIARLNKGLEKAYDIGYGQGCKLGKRYDIK